MSYGLKQFTADWAAHPLQPAPTLLRAPIEYRPADETTIAPLDRPQKLTLLRLSNRHSNRILWHDLRKTYGESQFTISVLLSLRELKLCELLPGQKYHSLTMSGAQCADLIGRQLQKQHDIHVAWIGGGGGVLTTLHCICGWSCGLRRGDRMQLKAAGAMSTHLNTLARMKELKSVLTLAPRAKVENA